MGLEYGTFSTYGICLSYWDIYDVWVKYPTCYSVKDLSEMWTEEFWSDVDSDIQCHIAAPIINAPAYQVEYILGVRLRRLNQLRELDLSIIQNDLSYLGYKYNLPQSEPKVITKYHSY